MIDRNRTITTLKRFNKTRSCHDMTDAAQETHDDVKSSQTTHHIHLVRLNNIKCLEKNWLVKSDTWCFYVESLCLFLDECKSRKNTRKVIGVHVDDWQHSDIGNWRKCTCGWCTTVLHETRPVWNICLVISIPQATSMPHKLQI